MPPRVSVAKSASTSGSFRGAFCTFMGVLLDQGDTVSAWTAFVKQNIHDRTG